MSLRGLSRQLMGRCMLQKGSTFLVGASFAPTVQSSNLSGSSLDCSTVRWFSTSILFHMTVAGTPSGSSFTPLEESQRADMSTGAVRAEGGYYRWEEATILFPKKVYEVKTSRGGGPGGQGVNSSSNKVELRIHLSKMVDEGVLDRTTREELEKTAAKFLTGDKEMLLISCHEHRSASDNTAACFAKAKQLIKDASYVPPLSTPELKANYSKLNHAIDRKRKKANVNKIQHRLKAERKN